MRKNILKSLYKRLFVIKIAYEMHRVPRSSDSFSSLRITKLKAAVIHQRQQFLTASQTTTATTLSIVGMNAALTNNSEANCFILRSACDPQLVLNESIDDGDIGQGSGVKGFDEKPNLQEPKTGTLCLHRGCQAMCHNLAQNLRGNT
jgi:hypothetical protein